MFNCGELEGGGGGANGLESVSIGGGGGAGGYVEAWITDPNPSYQYFLATGGLGGLGGSAGENASTSTFSGPGELFADGKGGESISNSLSIGQSVIAKAGSGGFAGGNLPGIVVTTTGGSGETELGIVGNLADNGMVCGGSGGTNLVGSVPASLSSPFFSFNLLGGYKAQGTPG